MNRLQQRFQALKDNKRKALIPYMSAGDPDIALTAEIMHALVAGGADVIELGVPFSDPAADGETIQLANERALAKGVDFTAVLAAIEQFRGQDTQTPVVLMGYLNSFERRGFAQSMRLSAEAGVDGVILVDCPVEALPDYRQALDDNGIVPILLVAPTTNPTRLSQILHQAGGFLYFVSLRGVTGKQKAVATEIEATVSSLKAQTDLPVCIGFGIRDATTAQAMAAFADGVVIGSALVARMYEAQQQQQDISQVAREFMASIRHAL